MAHPRLSLERPLKAQPNAPLFVADGRKGLEADLRRADARYAQLMNPPQDVLDDLQRSLGPNQAVLEYELGAERSYLFAIERARVAVFKLPPARVIREAVRAYYDAVRQLDATGLRHERAAIQLHDPGQPE